MTRSRNTAPTNVSGHHFVLRGYFTGDSSQRHGAAIVSIRTYSFAASQNDSAI
ncbi:hypothetical protein [Novosphingobium decolorationis]|uniref:Uncharacterized protein n=1 Tax=Novosphingobium decolorationis TaxID=2698673 RepID=A0ABX8EAA9_9SPHN|nr:hypothetical protein [Novosphingobium decolorationis]QVM85145.1 hypothetical protein HT578_16885 [Novosphingobium decolorationis]